MPGSSMPDVLDALVGPNGIVRTALDSLTPSVQVNYGDPDRNLKREALYVEGTPQWDQEWAALGHQSRSETYTLNMVVLAASGDAVADHQAVTERAFVIFDAAADALRASPNLGLTSYSAVIASVALDNLTLGFTNDNHRVARITAGVRIEARI